MEPSPQPSKSRGSDHDYFVSSETTNSWKTTGERSQNATSTSPACDSVMTTNRKLDDLVEVIEDGMVENMMLEQDMDAPNFGKNRISAEYIVHGMVTDSDSGSGSGSGSEYSDDSNQDSVSERKASDEANVRDKPEAVVKTSSAAGVTNQSVKKTTSPLTASEVTNERRMTNESSDFCLALESDDQNDACPAISLIDGENDVTSKVCDSSTMSTASGDESAADFGNEMVDEVDTSDVSSSISESVGDMASHSKLSSSSSKKPRRRQPPIMIGYKKRRKVTHLKKLEDEYQRNGLDGQRVSEAEDGSHHAFESSSSEENLFAAANTTLKTSLTRRSSSSSNEPSDKYCWTCHKDSGLALKCLACPRAFHAKCYAPTGGIDAQVDPNDFQCPECVAVLRADNINTRSPTLATVNLDQLCISLKHVIDLLKAQKDSHYFLGPVDTEEFPHYREYITHPMDLLMLEKNVADKMYGCTEAFLADVKWIVHNSIVFNSKASKITNVAKNLLKICKREVAEIETCAECYYNSLVRIDTWFIEVCKRPHILVWARLKGYPPWPAKALKCKDNMVDCRFFGAHDKAWVPLKDCFLYSESPPQPTKIKKSSHLELGIQELEKHIFKLKDKFGIFQYPPPRTPYQPANELDQIRLMLPKYDPKTVSQLATKYLIHPDRVKPIIVPKLLFDDSETVSEKKDNDKEDEKRVEDGDSESTGADDQDPPPQVPVPDRSSEPEFCTSSTSCTNSSDSENSTCPEKESSAPASNVPTLADVSANAEKNDDSASPPRPTASKAALDGGRKSSEDNGSKARKYVVVRDINSINATVVERPKPIEIAPKVSSSTSAPKVAIVTVNANTTPTSGAPSLSTSTVAKPLSLAERLMPRKPSAETAAPKESPRESVATNRKDSDQFDLDKVKEEPVDVENDKTAKKTVKGVPSLLSVSVKSKRAAPNNDLTAATSHNSKKAKTDANTTSSVNLSKTVTLSVVNPATNAKVVNVRPAVAPPKNAMQVGNGNYVIGSESSRRSSVDLLSNSARSKSTPSPSPVAKVVASTVQVPPRSNLANRSQVKILPRTSLPSSSALTNGPTNVNAASRPPHSVTAGTVKDASSGAANTLKVDSTTNKQSIQGLDEILLNEYHTHFKKFFEDTLEKIGGRGDLRAKIVSLQKENDNLKRTHELFVGELRREYETQIAELRATSIAKTQYDLAAEKLKFEQEKEKAVKEAKSKQWCSNCQKCANYYCCWNTAYCDFECQKEHWLSHMHVCKNDVKKKAAAESCENEPPRIMMQNDIANNYILNGYEKPGTAAAYTYQNSNPNAGPSRNVKRQPTKITATKAGTYRPLLPRISSTTNTSSLPSASVSAVSSSHLTASTQSSSENTTYPAVSSTSSLRPVPSAVPVRLATQFHK